MSKKKSDHIGFLILGIVLIIIVIGLFLLLPTNTDNIQKFKSKAELIDAFTTNNPMYNMTAGSIGVDSQTMKATNAIPESVGDNSSNSSTNYSKTNIQVQGVDEADIIKTDGSYIYAIKDNYTNNKLFIIKSYPSEEAEIISEVNFNNFTPQEMFINQDKLLVFGYSYYDFKAEENSEQQAEVRMVKPSLMNSGYTTIKIFDISDKTNIKLLKNIDIEGNYLTSRKINNYVYFIINSYPHFYGIENPDCGDMVPLYRETTTMDEPTIEDMVPIARCTDIGYINPIQAESFITVAAIDMDTQEINKEVIVGSGQNVYASTNNLYIAQVSWPRFSAAGGLAEDQDIKTVITKFNLDEGNITFNSTGEVKGYILNQFSMDEHNNHFRIATTTRDFGRMIGKEVESENHVFVLNENLETVGSLEDLAPGESIYSVRFMGDRGYVVTFKKVDPLFVIDLADPTNPSILGKLKIPGYSDYLHPYDETHIIGIGKDTVEAEEEGNTNFVWYKGIKMAIFDVSDVENPIEMHKEIIGDRGTDSEALHNHKAFLFDKEKNLLVMPILLAEYKEPPENAWDYGDYVFQGSYVYNIDLENGFDLKGTVTHYNDNEVFEKSGYYFHGNYSIKRNLFIEDVLYSFSNNRLQLNNLNSLELIKKIELGN